VHKLYKLPSLVKEIVEAMFEHLLPTHSHCPTNMSCSYNFLPLYFGKSKAVDVFKKNPAPFHTVDLNCTKKLKQIEI